MEKEYFKKADIEIKQSPIHRYGVFAKKDIYAKETVEECPVIIFNKSTQDYKKAMLTKRAFYWKDYGCVIALGYGSVYNHSEEPNAEYKADYENDTMSFIATKHIQAGSEIFINYGESYWHNESSSEASKKDIISTFKVLTLLLFLLVLSKIFPVDLYSLQSKSKLTTVPIISKDAFEHLYTRMKTF